MPKIVDPVRRREEILQAFLALARAGVRPVTSRRLTAEAGIAAGGIWHYFEDLGTVSAAALQRLLDQLDARVQHAAARDRGLAGVRGVLDELAPDRPAAAAEVRLMAQLRIDLAIRAADTGYTDTMSRCRDLLHTQLLDAISAGEVSPRVSADILADVLATAAAGCHLRSVTSRSADAGRGRSVLDACLQPWLTVQLNKPEQEQMAPARRS